MNFLVGAVIDVTISSVEQFGLLVDFEGRRGVILETNIYWEPDGVHRRMREDFRPGQVIRAKILVIAPDKFPEEFSASIKDLHPEHDPWIDPKVYAEGSLHSGTVRFFFDFGGAIVALRSGADVFVRTLRPGTNLNDEVNIVVRAVDPGRRSIEGEQI